MADRNGFAGATRLLAAAYTLFAVAAGSRALVQLAIDPGRAPVAYALSAVSAAFYLIGALAFRRRTRAAHRIALVACSFELLAVVVVGAFTVSRPDRWGDPTVWSAFGDGYGFIPVILPIAGLAYLRRQFAQRAQAPWSTTSCSETASGTR